MKFSLPFRRIQRENISDFITFTQGDKPEDLTDSVYIPFGYPEVSLKPQKSDETYNATWVIQNVLDSNNQNNRNAKNVVGVRLDKKLTQKRLEKLKDFQTIAIQYFDKQTIQEWLDNVRETLLFANQNNKKVWLLGVPMDINILSPNAFKIGNLDYSDYINRVITFYPILKQFKQKNIETNPTSILYSLLETKFYNFEDLKNVFGVR